MNLHINKYAFFVLPILVSLILGTDTLAIKNANGDDSNPTRPVAKSSKKDAGTGKKSEKKAGPTPKSEKKSAAVTPPLKKGDGKKTTQAKNKGGKKSNATSGAKKTEEQKPAKKAAAKTKKKTADNPSKVREKLERDRRIKGLGLVKFTVKQAIDLYTALANTKDLSPFETGPFSQKAHALLQIAKDCSLNPNEDSLFSYNFKTGIYKESKSSVQLYNVKRELYEKVILNMLGI